MKRYLCVKNVFYPKADPASGQMRPMLIFKAGKVYAEYINDAWSELTGEDWSQHMVTPQLIKNFKELESVDDTPPADVVQPAHDTMQWHREIQSEDGSGFFRGCLICAAIGFLGAITLIALFWQNI